MRARLEHGEAERLRPPRQFLRRRVERGVRHAERAEYARLQDLAEARVGDDLDDAAEHIGREAIFPHRARRVHQRKGGEPLHRFGRVQRNVDQIGRQHFSLDFGRPREAVAEARGVAHEVVDGHFPPRFGGLCLSKGGNEFRDGVGQEQPPVLDERHRGDADDGLGHRIDAIERVERRRRAAGTQRAERSREADLAALRRVATPRRAVAASAAFFLSPAQLAKPPFLIRVIRCFLCLLF